MTRTTLHHLPSRRQQRGISLIELMVGIAIGLLTIAVAIGALMVSRNVSGTVSDVSQIQQQASYALRAIGWQLREAGTPGLDLAPLNANDAQLPLAPVAFLLPSTEQDFGLSGTDTTLKISYDRDPIRYVNTNSTTDPSQQRDCLGGTNISGDLLLQSEFAFNASTNELTCTGSSSKASQAIVNNVANFSLRYLLQSDTDTAQPTIRYLDAATITANNQWKQVVAVEVCLVLYGNEIIDVPAGTKYTDCPNTQNGQSNDIDMTKINSAASGSTPNGVTANRLNRLHMTFRNVYQIRAQSQVG